MRSAYERTVALDVRAIREVWAAGLLSRIEYAAHPCTRWPLSPKHKRNCEVCIWRARMAAMS